jgi:hypothetical protein
MVDPYGRDAEDFGLGVVWGYIVDIVYRGEGWTMHAYMYKYG